MAITNLLSTTITLKHSPFLLLKPSTKLRNPKRPTIRAQSKNDDSVDGPDRLISAITYFYPFFDGVQYGKYVITQFAPIQTLIQPLVPAIRVFKSFPLNGLLVFFTLYFIVVRNPNFSRYVRFNTMQAIVLDVLLIFPDLLERSFNPSDGFGLDLMMSFDSTVFLFLLVSLVYGTSSCLLGQLPRLPIVAEAADSFAKEIDNHDTQNLAQATELWLPLSVEASVESRGIILLGTYLTATTFIFFSSYLGIYKMLISFYSYFFFFCLEPTLKW